MEYLSKISHVSKPEISQEAINALITQARTQGILVARKTLDNLISSDCKTIDVGMISSTTKCETQKSVENLSLRDLELQRIEYMLELEVPKTEIADRLSISRATLYRRIHELESKTK